MRRFPKFIAEVSSNHSADLSRALEFIDRAADIGCDGVKFQLFKIDELFAPEILATSAAHRKRRAWELPVSFLPDLAQRAQERAIEFSCTPFYLEAVDILEPYVDFLKIASYELSWPDLLRRCAATRKPIVLSTGMADLQEVRDAVRILYDADCRNLTLLHCVSGYPTTPGDANLAALTPLRSLANEFEDMALRVGWSDHTVEPGVIHRAVHRHGAEMIEFHIDLDGTGDEYAVGHCWTPEPMANVIHDTRIALRADGEGLKAPTLYEREERQWRADPIDGLRPLSQYRGTLAQ
ncbi:MAG: N-acetylneuraminate synthase family protein [Myxococcota bacterium]|jgi:N-acetylneuraminate synthase|nr:N-acetylneuraminate synthase family protein [Myxococcota bacterium]